MNKYKITWFDMYSNPQESEEVIEAESFEDARSFAEYKLKKDSIKDRQLWFIEPYDQDKEIESNSIFIDVISMLISVSIFIWFCILAIDKYFM